MQMAVHNRRCFNAQGKAKRIYTHEKAAKRDADRMNTLPGHRTYVAYKCDDCDGWHLGGFET